MKNRRRKLHINKKLVVILAILLSVGFAYITSAVNIGGVFTVFSSTYDVHFENLQVTDGSVEANTPTIDSENTEVSASVRFTNPGDYYEFTIDAVNAGDIDAMINTVSDIELTEDQEKYIDYTVTYADGEEPIKYHQLNSGDRCTFKVKASFKEDIETEDLPEDGDNVEVVLDTDYVKADSNRIKRRAEYNLYNVLKDEANSGSLAKKYTGEHQDSMDASKSTKDIYHWYAVDDTAGTTIKNKNNVIFANHCWLLIRTTDTGGARLLYNGEVDNNQCLDSRGTHVGYNGYSNKNLNNNYYYGTDYTYDSTNHVFSLSGTIEQATWSDSTYENLIGKYTCMKTTQNGTCQEIYLVESYNNSVYANVIPINSSSHYSEIGKTHYNSNDKSLSSVGYMYDKQYTSSFASADIYDQINNYPQSLNINIWFGDDIQVNANNTYTLINPFQISSTEEYSNIIGKYTLESSESNAQSLNVYYVVSADNSTYIVARLVSGGNTSDYNRRFIYGDSYTDNGDGTYTINNYNEFYLKDYYNLIKNNGSSILKNKYGCINSEYNQCTNVIKICGAGYYVLRYYSMNKSFKYANDFIYENGKYILNNDSTTVWNISDISVLNNYHYTCFNLSGECEELSYVFVRVTNTTERLYYVTLTNGEDIETALNNMINNENLNKKNSTIKNAIDKWYEKKMINYSDYIEDTIYCNEREVRSYGGFNKDGGSLENIIHFRHDNILCQKAIDKFSISNSIAKLKYPVSIISYSEREILNKSENILKTGSSFWTISPDSYDDDGVTIKVIHYSGSFTSNSSKSFNGLRPYISLSPTTFYTSGDGSMENPYVIYTE